MINNVDINARSKFVNCWIIITSDILHHLCIGLG